MSPPRPRVDEKLPSSAPETSQRRRGSFVTSWCIVAPTRGSGDAAGAAHAHRAAAAHPARRRGEERPRARRHDGVDAPLHHCARHAGAAGRRRCATSSSLPGLNFFLVRARAPQIIYRFMHGKNDKNCYTLLKTSSDTNLPHSVPTDGDAERAPRLT